MTDLIWSFTPWLLFLLATRFTSFYGAVALGLGLALEVVHPTSVLYWSRYAQAGSHAFLTLIVLGSVAIGHPFTESYARETTPKEVWGTREFHTINRTISLVWGLAFLVGTVSLIVAGSVTGRPFLLRILIPFGALAYAYTYTQRVITARREAAGSGDETSPLIPPA